MPYAIALLSKLKLHQLGGSASHTSRSRETPNADPKKENVRLIGSDSPDLKLEDLVKAKIAEQPQKRKIRPDAVYCVEFLLTASPEYFRPQCPTQAGYSEPDKLDRWVDASRQWLIEKYADRIVRAELHLDESTPHIHAYFVPLDQLGQLRCHQIFDGREKIRQFQDSYFHAMRPIGLERGIKGSRAQHFDIKNFYTIVNEAQSPDVDELNWHQIKAKAADRDRAVTAKQEIELTAKALAERVETLETENLHWKQQVEQLHDLPIETVAWRLGMTPSPSRRGLWFGYSGQVVLEPGSSSITLIMQVNDCNYRQAIAWVHDQFGTAAVESAAAAHAKSQAMSIVNSEPKPRFIPPVEEQNQWTVVQNYLTQEYLLPIPLLQDFHQRGLIYGNGQNAVFLMRRLEGKEPTGALLQHIDTHRTLIAQGTKRTEGWFHFYLGGGDDPVQRALLFPSPLEALSYVALEGIPPVRTVYFVADDQSLPVEFLTTVPKILIAYPNDDVGNRAALAISQILPSISKIPPQADNWNHQLQLHRRSLLHKSQPQQDLEF